MEKPIPVGIYLYSIGFIFILSVVSACRKEFSSEDNKLSVSDTLPVDYLFATGYCNGGGASLGIEIADTAVYVPSKTDSLPKYLLLEMPLPGDQGSQGSCSAWATVYGAGSYYVHTTTGKPYSDTGNLSPTFTYNQITQGNCTCTSILDNLYILTTQGASSLSNMPYDPGECLKQPNSTQMVNALSNKINGWQKLDLHNLSLIKRALQDKKPVIFSIGVDDGFNKLASPYIWNARSGSLIEGHAMVITGYDDDKNALRIMNSWSTAWADNGFAWIDYDFFLNNVIEGGYIII